MRSPWWLTSQGRSAHWYVTKGPGRAPTSAEWDGIRARILAQRDCPQHDMRCIGHGKPNFALCRIECTHCGMPKQPTFDDKS